MTQFFFLGSHATKLSGSAVIVDNATRLSKKGAVTWWHLDDGGEFVFQVWKATKFIIYTYSGLTPIYKQVALRTKGPVHLKGPNGLPVTKIFIFAPADAYDFICQV